MEENGSASAFPFRARGGAPVRPDSGFNLKRATMNQPSQVPLTSTIDRQSPAAGRVAFIQSCWHKDIVDQCRASFVAGLAKLGRQDVAVDLFEVPGAFEIPLQAKLLAQSGRYVAIVAAGFVVDGGI